MTMQKRVLLAGAALVLLGAGFVSGFLCSVALKVPPAAARSAAELKVPGDAPPAVRAGVLDSLRGLQEGYIRRDPREIDAFMRQLFPPGGDILTLGTEGGADEWVRGYTANRRFIVADWRGWGDFRLNVDGALVWSSGDVAWVASRGGVRFGQRERPVRFTAILTRSGNRWLFRQLQYQWDDSAAEAPDLLRARTWWRVAQLATTGRFR